MALSLEDYKYFDGKFAEVEKRFGPLHEKVNGIRDDLSTHVSSPCKDTRDHIERMHDPVKFWGTVVAVVTVLSTLAGGIIWLIQHA